MLREAYNHSLLHCVRQEAAADSSHCNMADAATIKKIEDGYAKLQVGT